LSAPQTLAGLLAMAAETDRGVTAIEHDGQIVDLRYRTLLNESLRIAGGLREEGLLPGERVALLVPEVSGFIRGFFGIAAAGLTPVPLCPPVQAGDIGTFQLQTKYLLAASRASAILTSTDVAPLLTSSAEEMLRIGECQILTIDALSQGPALVPGRPVMSDAPALIQFTSGSTAMPKGVMMSFGGLAANLAAIAGPAGLDGKPDDVCVSWLPLYHDMGLIGSLLTSVFSRVDTVIMSPVLFLKRPTSWLEAISRHRGSVSFAPTFAYDLCLRRTKPSQVNSLDLSSWRVAGCGAEPVRHETLKAFAERFAVAGFRASSFVPSYGLAEHALAVAFARDGLQVDAVDPGRLVRESVAVPATSDHAVQIVSCGRPFPGHELRIADEHGRPVPERQVGHILLRGPSVMTGYFEDDVSTREALRDGWLHTGDLGYVTGGNLFVCGRTKDLIIRHGRKYHPPDLELAIAGIDGIRPSGIVVFGLSQVDEPDQVVAVLETRASLKGDGVEDRVRRRIRETAGLELDHVILAPPGTIPRTTSGKVRRSETRARFQAGTLLAGGRPAVLAER